ncbi:hypothetical protein FRC09_017545 [Ceratobasidium sp. 395]|nr:hypothetical protein FRC09_017545 [Ceratobasidium sp. 395]
MAACHCKGRPKHDPIPPILSPVASSAVCKHWRQVAVNHRFLWAHLDLVVDVMDSDGKYYSPEIWVERSKGAPLSVHVQQPQYLCDDDYCDEEDQQELMPNQPLAPMVNRLISFLNPLMPQVCSLTTVLSAPWQSTLDVLVDNWTKHGTTGQAKVLKTLSNLEFPELEICLSRSRRSFFNSLQVLHLHNTEVTWRGFSFRNLVELEIELGDGSWEITHPELAAVMSSCPKLQRLALGRLLFMDIPAKQPKPVLLGELRELRIADLRTYDGENRTSLFESVLNLIVPGKNMLSVEVSLMYASGPSQQALDAVCSFVERSNVSKLRVHGNHISRGAKRDNPYFASQLGPLPRVQNLILEEFCFCNIMRIESRLLTFNNSGPIINTHHNPHPTDFELVLWPDVRNLYLRQCIIEKEYLRRLVLFHSVQSLYMRGCSNNLKAGSDSGSDLGASFKSRRSMEDCVQLLSQAGLKVVDSPTWDVSWPSFLL